MSAQYAALRLADKLLPKPHSYTCTELIVPLARQVSGISLWQIAQIAQVA